MKEISRVKPEDILHDTAVITLNNRHAGALMGGYDDSLCWVEKTKHVIMFGGIPGTEKSLKKFLEKKSDLFLAFVILYGSYFSLLQFIPFNLARPLAGPAAWGTCIKVFEKLGFENPVLSILALMNLEGASEMCLSESTFIPYSIIWFRYMRHEEKSF